MIPTPAPSPTPSAAATPPAEVRAVVLACRDGRLAVAGGGVLRLAGNAACPADAAGRAFALGFDPAGNVVVRIRLAQPGEALAGPDRIPDGAWAIAPVRPPAAAETVQIVIDVFVPPRTPPTDDIYLATDRSNWNATEIRMNRVDGRHFTATLDVPRGTTFAFQISRGSFGTLERDAAGAILPPHVVHADANTELRVSVAAWTDIS